MLDKDVYYVKKLKQQMLSIFNMVMKTEEMAMKETAESGELSVSEIHTLVAVGRRAPKTMSTIAQDLLINVSTLSIAINKLEKKKGLSCASAMMRSQNRPHQFLPRRDGPLWNVMNNFITGSWTRRSAIWTTCRNAFSSALWGIWRTFFRKAESAC